MNKKIPFLVLRILSRKRTGNCEKTKLPTEGNIKVQKSGASIRKSRERDFGPVRLHGPELVLRKTHLSFPWLVFPNPYEPFRDSCLSSSFFINLVVMRFCVVLNGNKFEIDFLFSLSESFSLYVLLIIFIYSLLRSDDMKTYMVIIGTELKTQT